MMRTAPIRLEVSAEQARALAALRAAYADACNRLVSVVRAHRIWNRVALHRRAYSDLRATTPLGSQASARNTVSSAPTVVSGRTAT